MMRSFRGARPVRRGGRRGAWSARRRHLLPVYSSTCGGAGMACLIRYRPGQAVTPPSWTTRPLRSSTGTSSQDRSGPVSGRPYDRADLPGPEVQAQRRGGHDRRREPLTSPPAQASIVSSKPPQLRSASAHTFGRSRRTGRPRPGSPADGPGQPHPGRAQRVQDRPVRPGEPTQAAWTASSAHRTRSSTSS